MCGLGHASSLSSPPFLSTRLSTIVQGDCMHDDFDDYNILHPPWVWASQLLFKMIICMKTLMALWWLWYTPSFLIFQGDYICMMTLMTLIFSTLLEYALVNYCSRWLHAQWLWWPFDDYDIFHPPWGDLYHHHLHLFHQEVNMSTLE